MVSPPQVNKRYYFSATSGMKKKLFLSLIGISVLHKDKNLQRGKTNNKACRYKNSHLASTSETTIYQMAFISQSLSCKAAVDEAEDPSG